jgi:hypothetical protein
LINRESNALIDPRHESFGRNDTGENEVTITGYVMAADWGPDDDVTAVRIETENDEYDVVGDDIGEELYDLLDCEVEVTGVVEEEEDGTKSIAVKSYEVISEGTDYFDDRYWYSDDWADSGTEQGEISI